MTDAKCRGLAMVGAMQAALLRCWSVGVEYDVPEDVDAIVTAIGDGYEA